MVQCLMLSHQSILLLAFWAAQYMCTCSQAGVEHSELGQAACCAVHHTLQDLHALFELCDGKQASSITDCMLMSDLS